MHKQSNTLYVQSTNYSCDQKKDPKDLPILMCFSYLSLQIKQAREKNSLACF